MDHRERGTQALRQAKRASQRGQLGEAERWMKLATQEAALWERFLAEAPQPAEDDEEAVRAELERRLNRFVEFAKDEEAGEAERDAYVIAAREAARTGANPPPPLRRRPGGSPQEAEQHMIHLLQGPEPDDGR
jgi:hypothetical protein